MAPSAQAVFMTPKASAWGSWRLGAVGDERDAGGVDAAAANEARGDEECDDAGRA